VIFVGRAPEKVGHLGVIAPCQDPATRTVFSQKVVRPVHVDLLSRPGRPRGCALSPRRLHPELQRITLRNSLNRCRIDCIVRCCVPSPGVARMALKPMDKHDAVPVNVTPRFFSRIPAHSAITSLGSPGLYSTVKPALFTRPSLKSIIYKPSINVPNRG